MQKVFSVKMYYIFFAGIIASCSTARSVYHEGGLLSASRYESTFAEEAQCIESAKIYVVSPNACEENMTTFFINGKKENQSLRIQNKNTFPDSYQVYNTFVTDTLPEDTVEEEPKLQPFIPIGAGVFAGGIAVTALGVATGGISIFIGIAAIIAGLLLTNFGYKKVKGDPKKWKGEKFALSIYYLLIPVGLFLMLYPVYLLFLV